MRLKAIRGALVGVLISSGLAAWGQQPTPPTPAPTPAPAPAQKAPAKEEPKKEATPEAKKDTKYRKYEDVITKEFKTQEGLFKVHRKEDRVYWEIPASMLGRDMLWQTEIAKMSGGSYMIYPGTHVNDKLVRWVRRDNKMYITGPSYDEVAKGDDGLKLGVADQNLPPILAQFTIESEGPNGSAVIDMSSFLVSDNSEFSVKAALGAGGNDSSRSYIDRVTAFPTNIESRVLVTFMGMRFGSIMSAIESGVGSPNAQTALIHYSLLLLPETPMTPRYEDSRVGYFSTPVTIFGADTGAVDKAYIERFRLEKKDPTAAVSEVVKPIVFYLSREFPAKYRPYAKKGIEEWNAAFEQAGFKDAITCKDAPSEKDDPTWDPEDARYSVIRWAPEEVENAMGPHVVDPRSGEVINAHVIVWHDIAKLQEEWYFSQCGAVDKRAQRLPFPDDLLGETVQFVIAHEVGHTLGLRHNFKASSYYTVQQLRDPKFVAKYDDSPSIMDYARFNYVAQPGDDVPLERKVGVYDKFAIEWGYRPVPFAKSPEDEKAALDTIAGRQVLDPYLRYGEYFHRYDPTEEAEDLGSDPVAASKLGRLNIARIAKLILPATSKFGEDYTRTSEIYNAVLTQYLEETLHVARVLGGVVGTDWHAGRGAVVYVPVSRAKQEEAAEYLLGEGSQVPQGLLDPQLLFRLMPTGTLNLETLFPEIVQDLMTSESLLRRLADQEMALGKDKAFTIQDLVSELFGATWKSLDAKRVRLNIRDRMVQNGFLDTIDGKVNGMGASQTDFKPLALEALRRLAKRVDKAVPRAADDVTAAHLLGVRKTIELILNAKSKAASSGFDGMAYLSGYRAKAYAKSCFPEMRIDDFARDYHQAKASGTMGDPQAAPTSVP